MNLFALQGFWSSRGSTHKRQRHTPGSQSQVSEPLPSTPGSQRWSRQPGECGLKSPQPAELSLTFCQTPVRIKEMSRIVFNFFLTLHIYSGEITSLLICSFIFCWIWIQNNNSGSRKKIRIHNIVSNPGSCHGLVSSKCVFFKGCLNM